MSSFIGGAIDSFVKKSNDSYKILDDGITGMKQTLVDNTKAIYSDAQNLYNNVSDATSKAMTGDWSGVKNLFLNVGTSIVSYGTSNATRQVSQSSQQLASMVSNRGAGALKASNNVNPPSAVADNYNKNLATIFRELQAQQRMDMRVSLRVAPLQNADYADQTIIDRLQYVLGNYQAQYNGSTIVQTDALTGTRGTTIYGFLFEALSQEVGLVFPYTPQVSFSQQVTYETTNLFQSNLAMHNYGGTPPPSISLNAKFTADTKENAKHMLSAIWFLKAASKSDFGMQATASDKRIPGTPPPTLYLNGYGDYLMNYIPVVIKGYNYSFPDDRDYTNVMFNLANAMKFVEYFSDSSDTIAANSNVSNIYTIRNMLPIQMDVKIDLLVQPNIWQHIHKFDLMSYKQGNIHIKNNPVKASSSPSYSPNLAESFERSGWTW